MNKKLIIGISAGVAAILAIVIAIVAVTGNLNFKAPDKNNDTSSQSSDINSNTESAGDNKNNDSSSTDANDDKNQDNGNDSSSKAEPSNGNKSLKKGTVVSIPVSIKNNPGFYAGEFSLTYDSSLLSYVDYEAGKILDQFEVDAKSDSIKIIANNSSFADVKKDGVLFSINLKLKKDAKLDECKLTLQKNGTMLGNVDVKEVKANLTVDSAKVK